MAGGVENNGESIMNISRAACTLCSGIFAFLSTATFAGWIYDDEQNDVWLQPDYIISLYDGLDDKQIPLMLDGPYDWRRTYIRRWHRDELRQDEQDY
jgi:hypothetical protein